MSLLFVIINSFSLAVAMSGIDTLLGHCYLPTLSQNTCPTLNVKAVKITHFTDSQMSDLSTLTALIINQNT